MYENVRREKRFSEARTKFYAAQIAYALGQLHSNKIIYRDIKPENVLMDSDGYLAIADFGLSKIVDEGQVSNTIVGTPEYMAPEILCGKVHNKQADWWSFGILVYEMLVGVAPFRHKNTFLLFQLITNADVTFPDEEKCEFKISEEAKDLILKLTQKNPDKRLGKINDADEVLAHPFFNGLDKVKLLNKQIEAEYKPSKVKIEEEAKAAPTQLAEDKLDQKSIDIIKKFEDEFTDFTQ